MKVLFASETIDGKHVSGIKITYWIWTDRVSQFRRKRAEAFWMWVAARLPREARRWSLVNLAVGAMGQHNGPDYATYIRMCDVLDGKKPRE